MNKHKRNNTVLYRFRLLFSAVILFVFFYTIVSATTVFAVLDITIITSDPSVINQSFTPEIGSTLEKLSTAYLGRNTTYTGPQIGLADPDNGILYDTIKWKVTIVGPSDLTPDMVDMDWVGFFDPPNEVPNITTYHYPFASEEKDEWENVIITSSIVARGSCDLSVEEGETHDNSCTHDVGFSLDENDVFTNADKINFSSNAPAGAYTIIYELIDTADGDVVLSNAYQVSFTLNPATINVPADYSTIQAAIDAAGNGDTINVSSGEYSESIIINKNLTLIGDAGDSNAGPGLNAPVIVDPGSCGGLISVEANGITIQGFILNGDSCDELVIMVDQDVTSTTIEDNEIMNNREGIDLSPHSHHNMILNNKIHDNTNYGIWIGGAINNTISGNEIYDNPLDGIGIGEGACSEECINTVSGNSISNNNIHNNGNGIEIGSNLDTSDGVITIDSNTITANSFVGVLIGLGTTGIVITNNNITNNSDESDAEAGITVFYALGNVAHNNTISGNYQGVQNLDDADNAFDAKNNYWGSASPDFESIIFGNVNYTPWYIDAAMTMLVSTQIGENETVADEEEEIIDEDDENVTEVIVPEGSPIKKIVVKSEDDNEDEDINVSLAELKNSTGDVELVNNFTLTRQTSVANYTAEIPAGTVISGGSDWDGKINVPTIRNAADYSPPSGSVDVVVDVGSGTEINFSNKVKITIGGKAGKKAAWARGTSALTEITTVCDNVDDPTNINANSPRECYIDSGSDLVIWTYHFTQFAAFTPPSPTSPSPAQSGGGGSSGGGGGSYGWQCGEWSECSLSGKQTRTCSLVPNGASATKSKETRTCTYTAPAAAPTTETAAPAPAIPAPVLETAAPAPAVTAAAPAAAPPALPAPTGFAALTGNVTSAITTPGGAIAAIIVAILAAFALYSGYSYLYKKK